MLALLESFLLADCGAPSGTDALLARPERVIVVGEIHGTAEAPVAFGAIVCQAAQAGPVTVALEYPETAQSALDAYIAATDAVTARAILVDSGLFSLPLDDGRGSEAMLAMLERVRSMRQRGQDVAFRAFQPKPDLSPQGQAWFELNMGHALARAVANRPSARLIALVGDFHARNTPLSESDEVGLPAAGHLPVAETLTLQIARQGGSSWSCQKIGSEPLECGAHRYRDRTDPQLRGVYLEPTPDGAYDGIIALGPATASPPADLKPAT